MNRQVDILGLLVDAGIPEAHRLAELAEPSWHLTARRVDPASLTLGESRFGGSPDLPEGFTWPEHRGRPLTFLAQIDLGQLDPAWLDPPSLPSNGWLLFFYDVAEQPWGYDPIHRGGASVIFLDTRRDALRRVAHPDVTSAGGPFECCRISWKEALVLPDLGDRVLGASAASLSGEMAPGYIALVAGLHAGAGSDQTPGGRQHQLLGHPRLLQGDMRGECQLVTHGIYCGDPSGCAGKRATSLINGAAAEWRLLLELDTDPNGPDWEWGDEGRIYFWIRRTDLQECAFDRIWLVLQSR